MSRPALNIESQEQCYEYYRPQLELLLVTPADGNGSYFEDTWCPPSFDTFLCWPPSPPSVQTLPCPSMRGADPSKSAERECRDDGTWDPFTDYQKCIIPEMQGVMDDLHANSPEEALFKLEIARVSRVIEMVGLVISMLAIILSVLVFSYFRSLRNNRTRMHLNLFGAMLIQIIVRLTLYIDQYVTRNSDGEQKGIDNTAVLCESFYILLEYARTAMFLWMFIEGHYLHSMLTITVFSDRPNFVFYYVLGWGLPVIMTAVWAAVTVTLHSSTQCMWGYSLSPYFWILEGPRLAIILTNLLFLLNILRVLITKLKASVSNETQQVKKAVRAAIVLLPLLGITNSLQMVTSLLDQRAWTFAAWSYLNTILTSFQGFFVALIYCFLNQEVRITLHKFFKNYSHSRSLAKSSRRFSMSTNVQSEAIPMTATVRASVLAVIGEDSSEKEATHVNVPLMSTIPESPDEKEAAAVLPITRTGGELASLSARPQDQSPESNNAKIFRSDFDDVRYACLTRGLDSSEISERNAIDKFGKVLSLPRNGKVSYTNPVVGAYRSLENVSKTYELVSYSTESEKGAKLRNSTPFLPAHKNLHGHDSSVIESAKKPLVSNFVDNRDTEPILKDDATCDASFAPSPSPTRYHNLPQHHIQSNVPQSPAERQTNAVHRFSGCDPGCNLTSSTHQHPKSGANFPAHQQLDCRGNSLSTSELFAATPVMQLRNGVKKAGVPRDIDANICPTPQL